MGAGGGQWARFTKFETAPHYAHAESCPQKNGSRARRRITIGRPRRATSRLCQNEVDNKLDSRTTKQGRMCTQVHHGLRLGLGLGTRSRAS